MPTEASLLVAVLCADWCGTCRDYRAVFDSLQAQFPDIRFVWIDVEDQADLVDPVDVADFPTLLIGKQGQVQFFGTILPHRETLARLIQVHLGDAAALGGGDGPLQALLLRLRLQA